MISKKNNGAIYLKNNNNIKMTVDEIITNVTLQGEQRHMQKNPYL